MNSYRRPLWLYPLFQIPMMLLALFLLLAILFWFLGLGRPNVAVAIAIDLSGSTYQPKAFNAAGTVMSQEIDAVNSYLEKNAQLRNPNQVKIYGFRSGKVKEMTPSFDDDHEKIKKELNQSMDKIAANLESEPERDDLNEPIQQGIRDLSNISDTCREILLVSDTGVDVTPSRIISKALTHKVRINAIGFDGNVPNLQTITTASGGLYVVGDGNDLEAFFRDKFFFRFNNNLKWVVLWLGSAWIALMWVLTLPLDRWFFQDLLKLHWSPSGHFALGNALFWSVLTPIILWRLWEFLGLPFFSAC